MRVAESGSVPTGRGPRPWRERPWRERPWRERPGRLGVLLLALAVAMTGVAGCSRKHGAGTATPSGSPAATTPGGVGGLGTGGATPTAGATGSPQPATYPTDARSYAEAAITAWINGQAPRLAQLTAPGVAVNFANIPGHPDPHWQYNHCEGTAGGPYCIFRNNDGDELTLRVVNQYLGQPHAITEVMFDRTGYPANVSDHVRSFFNAWAGGNRQRMLSLANEDTVNFVTPYPPPADWTVGTPEGAAGHSYVNVTSTAGFSMTVKVLNANIGMAHAIECAALGTTGC
jgi:hypothetical protein